MQDDKNKVEAVLFTTGRFLDLEELSRMCGIGSIGYLKELLISLMEDYDKKTSALKIIEQGNKFKLNIKKDYLYLTESLLTDCELDRPTQETLAVIAYKNPAMQSEIIKIRGNGAYDHIKILKDMDFIGTEPSGRTRVLKLTNKFYDYFDVVEDQLKSKMQQANKTYDSITENVPDRAENNENLNSAEENNSSADVNQGAEAAKDETTN